MPRRRILHCALLAPLSLVPTLAVAHANGAQSASIAESASSLGTRTVLASGAEPVGDVM